MKKILILCLLIGFITQSNQLLAVKPANTVSVEKNIEKEAVSTTKKLQKQEKRTKKLQKLTRKIESKLNKQMEKMEMQKKRGVLDEPKVRLGIICLLAALACGLLVGLGVLGSLFSFIGGILGVAGIVLLILGLLGY